MTDWRAHDVSVCSVERVNKTKTDFLRIGVRWPRFDTDIGLRLWDLFGDVPVWVVPPIEWHWPRVMHDAVSTNFVALSTTTRTSDCH